MFSSILIDTYIINIHSQSPELRSHNGDFISENVSLFLISVFVSQLPVLFFYSETNSRCPYPPTSDCLVLIQTFFSNTAIFVCYELKLFFLQHIVKHLVTTTIFTLLMFQSLNTFRLYFVNVFCLSLLTVIKKQSPLKAIHCNRKYLIQEELSVIAGNDNILRKLNLFLYTFMLFKKKKGFITKV